MAKVLDLHANKQKMELDPQLASHGACKAAALDVSSCLLDILGHEGSCAMPPAFPLAKSLLARDSQGLAVPRSGACLDGVI